MTSKVTRFISIFAWSWDDNSVLMIADSSKTWTCVRLLFCYGGGNIKFHSLTISSRVQIDSNCI